MAVKEEKVFVDAENAILGRLASYAAKQALLGKNVIIVNSEKSLISGTRANIIKDYLQKRTFNKVKFPSMPEQILRRTIRGMLSYKQGRGEAAYKKIMCYKGIPEEFKNEKMIKSGKDRKDLMSLDQVSKMMKGRE